MRVLRRPVTTLSTVALTLVGSLALTAVPAHADQVRDQSWHLAALDLPELHKITQGEGVTVAVVDTGVDANHPDLKGNVLPGVDLFGDTRGQVDRSTHGTEMASLIAGHGHGPNNQDGVLGIAPKAKILPVTVIKSRANGIAPKAIATGIDWAVDHGANIINVSLWSPSDDDLKRSVERAWDNNVLVVAAVGNRENAVIGWPARHPGALAVSGTDRKGGFGPESIAAEETDLAAPSVDLERAAPGGRYTKATSVSGATAVVSGAAALVRAKYPDLKVKELFQRLAETSRDAGPPGRDDEFGWGVLDLKQALLGQPDGRAEKTAATPTAAPVGVPDWEDDRGLDAAEIAVLVAGFLLLVVLIITPIIVVRRRRRRREALSSAGAPPTAGPYPGSPYPGGSPQDGAYPGGPGQPGSYPGGPVPPQQPGQPDSVWQPPNR